MGRPLTRVVLWWLLVGAWLVAVWYMWDATVTVPSAGRLEESRQVAIPTVRTFWAAVAFSGLELAVILATLWPWRPELYATRMAAAVLALVAIALWEWTRLVGLRRHATRAAVLGLSPPVGVFIRTFPRAAYSITIAGCSSSSVASS